MNDTYRHKGLRKRLVTELRDKGIRDERILTAMNTIPRHFFLEKAFEEIAYEDRAFPIGEGQTISQPFTVAYQTQLLELHKRDKVLEIGTGSGYQAAILATMGARVFTVERHEPLFLAAKHQFEVLGLANIRSYLRDGYKGLPEFAPFDKILVTAAAPYIPTALKEQLKVGGILVIPVGKKNLQYMYRIERLSANEYKDKRLDPFRFVPMLPGIKEK